MFGQSAEKDLSGSHSERTEQRFDLLWRTMQQGVVFRAPNGRISDCNPAAERILGLSREELIRHGGQDPRWAPTRDDGSEFPFEDYPSMQALRTGRRVDGAVMRIFHPARKEHRWIKVCATPIVSESTGKVREVYAIIEDVTDARLYDDRVRTLSLAISRIPVSVVITDPAGNIIYVNSRFEQVTGYSAAEAMGRNPRFLKFDGQRIMYETMWATIRSGHEWRGEFHNRRKDGEIIWESAWISPIIEDGNVVCYVGVNEDITERKRNEEELRRTRERFDLAAAGTIDGIWEWDILKGTTYFSPRSCELLGYEPEHLQPTLRTWYRMLHPEDRRRMQQALQDHLAHGTPYDIEHRLKHRDGSYRWFQSRGLAQRDANGLPVRMAGSITDITQRKAAEQSLKDAKQSADLANAAKDQLIAIVSHELRTPLTPVLIAASEMAHDPSVPDPMRQQLQEICRHVQMEARLIDDLLDLSRIVSGKLSLDLRAMDLRDAIRAAVRVCRPSIDEKSLNLIYPDSDEPLPVIADAGRLQQVFWNILGNATKFTRAGGTIHIRCFTRAQESPRQAVVEVADTGCGMSPENLSTIFDMFQQASEESRRKGGLGLGLTISRSIVQLHGGDIQASSLGLGKGTTLAVTIPLSQVPANTPATHSSKAAPNGHGRRILLVEDNEPTARVMAAVLKRHGYSVDTAHSVREARHFIQTVRYDLLLTDLGLPDGSGIDILTDMPSATVTPAIALSGYGTDQDKRNTREVGFKEHLVKPVDMHQLLTTIAQVLQA